MENLRHTHHALKVLRQSYATLKGEWQNNSVLIRYNTAVLGELMDLIDQLEQYQNDVVERMTAQDRNIREIERDITEKNLNKLDVSSRTPSFDDLIQPQEFVS